MFRNCLKIAMPNCFRVDVINLKKSTKKFNIGNNVKNLFCNLQARFRWSPRHFIRYFCAAFCEAKAWFKICLFSLSSCQKILNLHLLTLREKCLYLEFFWSVSLRIQSECGKIRTRKTPNTDTFQAVLMLVKISFFRPIYTMVASIVE